MDRIEFLKNTLSENFYGGAWHGPSVLEVLDELSPKEAEKKLGSAHNIGELIYHLTTWKIFALKRLQGDFNYKIDTPEKDFGNIGRIDDFELETLLMELRLAHEELIQAVEEFDEAKLDEIVPDRKYTYFTMLNGIANHDAYHSGQIILLKKIGEKLRPDDDF